MSERVETSEKMNVLGGVAGSASGTCSSHHAVNGNFVSVKESIAGFFGTAHSRVLHGRQYF